MTISKTTLVSIFLGIIALAFGWLYFTKDSSKELDEYRLKYDQDMAQKVAKFHADSVLFQIQYKYLTRVNDSLKTAVMEESIKRTKVIKYYEKKIKDISTMPISVVDQQLDSLFSGLK